MIKKRKEVQTGWVHKGWKLTKKGLCIYHSMIWTRKGPVDRPPYCKDTRIRITIEEI